MRLSDLLAYESVAVQCHDNPDADAIASGYALCRYFAAQGKKPLFFHKSRHGVSKPDLRLLMEALDIGLAHAPDLQRVDGLLVTVDCQHGAGNVGLVAADTVAVIDHHVQSQPLPSLHVLHSSLASCSTLVWHMLHEEGFALDEALSTALVYGLYGDSNGFAELEHILDRGLRDISGVNLALLRRLKSSNLTLEDLHTASTALRALEYDREGRFVVVPVPPCDQNLLGFISDLTMQVDGVDMVVVFFENPAGVKFSVRTAVREVKANDLARWCAGDGMGSGGGHEEKAGGWIDRAHYRLRGLPDNISAYFRDALNRHLAAYTVLDSTAPLALRAEPWGSYVKLPVELGHVPCLPLFDGQKKLHIRMLEGDITVDVRDDLLLMIGLQGEVYPIAQAAFAQRYTVLDRAFAPSFAHNPYVRDSETGKTMDLVTHARACVSRESRVLARRLEHGVKLFTAWDRTRYMRGDVGDWLVANPADPSDMYVVTQDLWPQLYRKAEEV